MGFSNRVITTTREKFLPKVVDTVLGQNFLADRILTKAKRFTGTKIKKAVKISKNTTGGSFIGYDLLSTNATDNRIQLEFDPKFYQIAVSIPLTDLAPNAGEEAFIDLMKAELEGSAQDAVDDIGTMLYGDGTGNGGKDFMGLDGIINDSGNYGGKSRTTYPTLRSTKTNSNGTLTLLKMAALHDAVSSGKIVPTMGLTDEATFSFYEALIKPSESYVITSSDIKSGVISGTGSKELHYRGMPIYKDEKCPAGKLYFLNEMYLDWYKAQMAMTEAINFGRQEIEGNEFEGTDTKGIGFSWDNWQKPVQQAAIVTHIYLGGQLISTNPKRHGVLYGITGI